MKNEKPSEPIRGKTPSGWLTKSEQEQAEMTREKAVARMKKRYEEDAEERKLGVKRRRIYQGGAIGVGTVILGYMFLPSFFDWNWWQTMLGVFALMVFVQGIHFVLIKIGFL